MWSERCCCCACNEEGTDDDGGNGILNFTDATEDDEPVGGAAADNEVVGCTELFELDDWSRKTSWISEAFLFSADKTWRPCKPAWWDKTRTLLSFHDILYD